MVGKSRHMDRVPLALDGTDQHGQPIRKSPLSIDGGSADLSPRKPSASIRAMKLVCGKLGIPAEQSRRTDPGLRSGKALIPVLLVVDGFPHTDALGVQGSPAGVSPLRGSLGLPIPRRHQGLAVGLQGRNDPSVLTQTTWRRLLALAPGNSPPGTADFAITVLGDQGRPCWPFLPRRTPGDAVCFWPFQLPVGAGPGLPSLHGIWSGHCPLATLLVLIPRLETPSGGDHVLWRGSANGPPYGAL